MEDALYKKFANNVKANSLIKTGDKVGACVSGGPDSVFLFQMLKKLQSEINFELKILHYNHKIRGAESESDQEFCRNLAEKNQVEFIVGHRLPAEKINSEEKARILRYAFIEAKIGEGRVEVLAIGHNADDSAETTLLNLIRGAGNKGVKNLPLKSGKFIRPLLIFSKKEILDYLKKEKIDFQKDSSNDDISFARNRLRHKIIPEMEKINPNLIETLKRFAEISETNSLFLEQIAKSELNKISVNKIGKIEIDLKKFNLLSPALKRQIIRNIIEDEIGLTDISFAQIEEVLKISDKNIGKKLKNIKNKLKFEVGAGKIIVSKII